MLGIPGECEMDCHRVKLDGTGKAAAEPARISENKMVGMWAPRAFAPSWDGKTIINHTFDGFRVTNGTETRDYKVQLLYHNLWWSPDNKHFLLWLPAGIALADVNALGPPGNAPKTKVIYRAGPGRFPMGVAWSPDGNSIYVNEHFDDGKETGSAIRKISTTGAGGAGAEIHRHKAEITFFMLPDSWYEDGSGPKTKAFQIVFGAKDGLFTMTGDGQNVQQVCEFAPDGVGDVIWDPSEKPQLLLRFQQPLAVAPKKVIRGLYLVHTDKKGDSALEQLTDQLDLHTVYFSRKGKYICWANQNALFLRETAKQENATRIVISGATGVVKGFYWDDSEKKIAIAQANKLWVYDVTSKSATCAATVDEKAFIAEPHWKGDEIVFSTFSSTAAKRRLEDPKAAQPNQKK